MATRMQALAISDYGCSEFVSVMEGTEEIAISYWSDLEQIKAWKQDAEHLAAQELGRSKWYSAYRIEIVEIIRSYGDSG